MQTKNITRYIAFAIGITILGSSCAKKLDELNPNPDGFTSTRIEYLLPTAIDKTLREEYTDAYNNYIGKLMPMMQVIAYDADPTTGDWYNIRTDLNPSFFDRYYKQRMNNIKGMEQIYNTQLSEEEKKGYAVYLSFAKILGAYATAQTTDLYDDIPYSEAFQGINTLFGGTPNYTPKYDDQKSIYFSILDDLKTAAADLATVTLQPAQYEGHRVLPVQDILYNGSLEKWRKFANSLRLRYALRIADADPARARAEIQDLISTNAPLILTNTDNAVQTIGPQTNSTGGDGGTVIRALFERGAAIYAPKYMIDNMKAAADPRMLVLFRQKTAGPTNAADYKGLPASFDARTGVDLGTISRLDTAMFIQNANLPSGVAINAADVNFNLAEAYFKGLTGAADNAKAKQYYEEGMRQSVAFYYDIYIKSSATSKRADVNQQPSASAVTAMINSSTYLFNAGSFLQQLAYQKWVNTNFMEMYETYAEFRRLDLPAIPADVYLGQTVSKVPVRVPYPSTESSNNAQNYSAVSAKSNDVTKVWWDK